MPPKGLPELRSARGWEASGSGQGPPRCLHLKDSCQHGTVVQNVGPGMRATVLVESKAWLCALKKPQLKSKTSHPLGHEKRVAAQTALGTRPASARHSRLFFTCCSQCSPQLIGGHGARFVSIKLPEKVLWEQSRGSGDQERHLGSRGPSGTPWSLS